MNPGNLNILASLLVLAPERGEAGEVLERTAWKEMEKMWLGYKDFGGRALNTSQREAAQIERVFEGWFRYTVVAGTRLVAAGVTYKVDRVDPQENSLWMLVYCSAVV